jgi:coproporphyrinogen III oxidase-like Fe-S oxidoreductase
VSNFQRNEKYSKHNYGYWSGLDYLGIIIKEFIFFKGIICFKDPFIGIGPGAHGRLTDPKTKMRHRTIRVRYIFNIYLSEVLF